MPLTPDISTDNADLQAELRFMTGVTADGGVDNASFWSWVEGVHPEYGDLTAAKWGDSRVAGTGSGIITYAFDPASNFTEVEKANYVRSFALWSAVADVKFEEVAADADPGSLIVRIDEGYAAAGYDAAGGHYTLDHGADDELALIRRADITIDTSVPGFEASGSAAGPFGGYGLSTIVHEIGHMLGLGHPGRYDGEVTPAQQFGPFDYNAWSVMSYISWAHFVRGDWPADQQGVLPGTFWDAADDGWREAPHTMMPLDILAIQRLYGAARETPFSGGQVYGFNSNITADGLAAFYDFNSAAGNRHPVVTIWNAGTGNTLDLSGAYAQTTIDLRDGHFSSFAGMVNNIAIAFGTVVETGIGGHHEDLIQGNAFDNRLVGNDGDDRLFGDSGDDRLDGGPGNDVLQGGAGQDTALLAESGRRGLVVAAGTEGLLVTGGGGADRLAGVELVQLADAWLVDEGQGPLQKLYLDLLGRPGDAGGLEYWGDRPVAEAARFFSSTADFATRFLEDGELTDASLARLYQVVLGRDADAEGMAFWSAQPYLPEIVAGITGSAEAMARLVPVAEGWSQLDRGWAPELARLYDTLFDRLPDARGFESLLTLLEGANDPAAAARFMLAAGEFTGGALADGDFVDLLYANALGREADAAGHDYWTGLIAAEGRDGVALALSESAEHLALTAAMTEGGILFA
jgi:Ca2+-binding RTX toxin-like protein